MLLFWKGDLCSSNIPSAEHAWVMTCMKRWSRAQLRHERRAGGTAQGPSRSLLGLHVLAELPRLSTADSQQLRQTIAARATAGVKPANLPYQARLSHCSERRISFWTLLMTSLCRRCLHSLSTASLGLTSCGLHIADSSRPNDF